MLAAVGPGLAERLTLLLNHVLGSEAVATERLRPHAGRSLELQLAGWPSLLPAPPPLAWRITPAGLLEWCGPGPLAQADLRLLLDASNPAALVARVLGGSAPSVQIEGDAQLAGDVNWLVQNLRWDVAADVERLFGPTVAQPMLQFGAALSRALRSAWAGAEALRERWRPDR